MASSTVQPTQEEALLVGNVQGGNFKSPVAPSQPSGYSACTLCRTRTRTGSCVSCVGDELSKSSCTIVETKLVAMVVAKASERVGIEVEHDGGGGGGSSERSTARVVNSRIILTRSPEHCPDCQSSIRSLQDLHQRCG